MKTQRKWFIITQEHVDAQAERSKWMLRNLEDLTAIQRETARAGVPLGRVLQTDIGKRVYFGGGQPTQVENDSQRDSRLLK